ncbi:MAG: DUF5683 domain-containing protein [Marinilabiliaceae bacterium]
MTRTLCPLASLLATLLILALSGRDATAQDYADPNIIEADTAAIDGKLARIEPVIILTDTLVLVDGETVRLIPSVHVGQLGHSPHTATMYAAILPGLGQIYNKKYWKLPLLYGGAAALGYAIHFNNKYLKRYSNAYRDFLLGDPNNKSYMYFVNKAHLTEADVQGVYKSWFQNSLKKKKDYYRRYRDMSIFGMAGLYIVQIVDACVDAHFFNFDVSDDLAINWAPAASPETGVGAMVAIRF